MKVYLLYKVDYTDEYPKAVFSSKEKAELHKDVLQQHAEYGSNYYVKEFEVKD